MPPRISLRNVSKSFGTNHVLAGVDLTIADGESLAIIGCSGSGKSVLLKCILGLVSLDCGTIAIDNEDIWATAKQHQAALRNQMGMLFQYSALFDSLSVWQNICFAELHSNQISPAQAKAKAAALLQDGETQSRGTGAVSRITLWWHAQACGASPRYRAQTIDSAVR